jgi:CRISPR system Cascade subunit CasC
MQISTHILQQYPLSNPNRDLSGAPKSFYFGGYRRSAISAQCLSRSARFSQAYLNVVEESQRFIRSRDFSPKVLDICASMGCDEATSYEIVDCFDKIFCAKEKEGKKNSKSAKNTKKNDAQAEENGDSDSKSAVLATLGVNELYALVEHFQDANNRQTFLAANKDTAQNKLIGPVIQDLTNIDIASFGRFFASNTMKDFNVRKSVTYGFAMSVHEIEEYHDDFTAVDDLAINSGAAHLNLRSSHGSLFYRFSNIDCNLMWENLRGVKESLRLGVKANLLGTIYAQPSGHRGQFGQVTLPDHILITISDNAATAIDMAKAYLKPVQPDLNEAVKRLHSTYQRYANVYGIEDRQFILTLSDECAFSESAKVARNIDELVASVLELI